MRTNISSIQVRQDINHRIKLFEKLSRKKIHDFYCLHSRDFGARYGFLWRKIRRYRESEREFERRQSIYTKIPLLTIKTAYGKVQTEYVESIATLTKLYEIASLVPNIYLSDDEVQLIYGPMPE